jgi:hypothetical protein
MQILRHEQRAGSFDGQEGSVAAEELAIVEPKAVGNQTGQNPVSSSTVNGSQESAAKKGKNKKRKKYLKSLEADAQSFVTGFQRAKAIDAEAAVLHRKFKDVLEEMCPVFERVRYGFAHLRKDETVMGERTGSAWADRYIGVTYDWLCRCLTRSKGGTLLLTDGTKVVAPTPAKSDRSDTGKETSLPQPTQTLPTLPPADTADWTDNQYIEKCVRFIATTLKSLESDPQRFIRVATAVAEEILGEMGRDRSNAVIKSRSQLTPRVK